MKGKKQQQQQKKNACKIESSFFCCSTFQRSLCLESCFCLENMHCSCSKMFHRVSRFFHRVSVLPAYTALTSGRIRTFCPASSLSQRKLEFFIDVTTRQRENANQDMTNLGLDACPAVFLSFFFVECSEASETYVVLPRRRRCPRSLRQQSVPSGKFLNGRQRSETVEVGDSLSLASEQRTGRSQVFRT